MVDPLLHSLYAILTLNTRLYKNCLGDVSDEIAGRLVAERTSTMIFIAVHCLDARIFMADSAGILLPHPFPEIASARRLEDIRSYPPLKQVLPSWIEVSVVLIRELETLPPEALLVPSTRDFPIGEKNLLGALTFLVQHESYHIGQLSLLRRIHGLTAMSYSKADVDT